MSMCSSGENMQKTITKGFSLLEMVVVIALMAIVMLMVGPNLKNALMGGKKTGAQASLRSFKMAIEEFHEDTGSYPRSLADLYEKTNDPKIAKLWKPASGAYLDQKQVEKLDPWKKEYQYELTKGGQHPFELWSWGGSGAEDEDPEHKLSVWDL